VWLQVLEMCTLSEACGQEAQQRLAQLTGEEAVLAGLCMFNRTESALLLCIIPRWPRRHGQQRLAHMTSAQHCVSYATCSCLLWVFAALARCCCLSG
jgi:hypothetical protein